jgi:hypothetical protein
MHLGGKKYTYVYIYTPLKYILPLLSTSALEVIEGDLDGNLSKIIDENN